jgi:hypothetical protein
MEKNNFLIYIFGLAIIIVSIFLYTKKDALTPQKEVASFAECVEAGYPVMESYPRQCRDSVGNSFTENIGNALDKQNLIRVTNITPNQKIVSPLTITGEARGYWYFEASFPVRLEDANGNDVPLTPSYAMAQGEWMTEDFVPFSSTHTFSAPGTPTGTLILQKDNPSGLPENDDFLEIPVNF